ncbi:hypothetical protein PHYPO_G00134120 [Pangasianodon hypophthalmus]|uniref:Uncharacterized protein n=1 Tax=Pangasianodon hypophthalmus TaxID=310915 RepID=A0A5N5KKH5_PANHP|nr:hypothetical protein PHYPO_G00134120 [Pangasianodon hypophthalmus]
MSSSRAEVGCALSALLLVVPSTGSPSETPRQRQWLVGSRRFSRSRRTPKRQQRRKSHREQIRKQLPKQHSSTHVLSAGHRCQTPRLSSSILRELPVSAPGTLGRNDAIQLGQLIQLLETDSGYDVTGDLMMD